MDIEQGNIFTQEEVSRLRPGMSEAQVRSILGSPVLVHALTTHETVYVYTFKSAHGDFTEKRVECFFLNGTLREIRRG